MGLHVQQWSQYSLSIIAEPTGTSDGAEIDVPIRSVRPLIKKLEAALKKHDKKYGKKEK